jgi:hypothetical protein
VRGAVGTAEIKFYELTEAPHQRRKLTAAQVSEIRLRYMMGRTSARDLAKYYDVSQNAVMSIVTRRTWRHVP